MKHFILSIAFTLIVCIAFAQTKQPDSTKKTTVPPPVHSALLQQKIWPEYYINNKNKGSVIIKPSAVLELRGKL